LPGIAFLPDYAFEEERGAGERKWIPLQGDHSEFYIQLIYRKDRWLSPAFGAFIQQMKQQ
jgi:DNA-binding transcriptional LysR family regulator